LSAVFVSTGCSVFHPTERSGYNGLDKSDASSIEQLVVKQNITSHSFFISKARIELISNEGKDNFLATIKFIYPDTFLLSLRSKTGIEAARIFFTSDTILINDRINRELRYGRLGNAGRKYGVTPEIIPVLLGDFIGSNGNQKDNQCVNGIAVFNTTIAGSKIRYEIDCGRAKVTSFSKESSNGNSSTIINFSKFIRVADSFFPSDINVDYSEMKLNIKIDKIQYPWNGNIEFIHGSNYELVELL
jgi:hypothetical protein